VRFVTNQPQVDLPGAIGDENPAVDTKTARTRPHPQASGYDGAIGVARAAIAEKPTCQVHSVDKPTQALVGTAANLVERGPTAEVRLRGLRQLAKLAQDAPEAVREALRYDVGEPKYSLFRVAIEDRIAAKLDAIFDAALNDPEYAARYERAAEVAGRITLEHSSPVMARNYLAAVAATPTQLYLADERVKSQGAAHVACVADVIGEHMYPTNR
jgi:hypothetical protein